MRTNLSTASTAPRRSLALRSFASLATTSGSRFPISRFLLASTTSTTPGSASRRRRRSQASSSTQDSARSRGEDESRALGTRPRVGASPLTRSLREQLAAVLLGAVKREALTKESAHEGREEDVHVAAGEHE